MKDQLTQKDMTQIAKLGISEREVRSQLAKFEAGSSFIALHKPATIGDGILSPSETQRKAFINQFRKNLTRLAIEHFVPASGAATRMFRNLYPFLENSESGRSHEEREENNRFLDQFLQGLKHRTFPFADELERYVSSFERKNHREILHYFLTPRGLNYGQLPKALIKFHRYSDGSRTPLGEHVMDGISLTEGYPGVPSFHFTITRSHEPVIREHLHTVTDRIRSGTPPVCTLSFQEDNTSTIAVDPDNRPVRDDHNQLVFRPGGHGALLQNLNSRTADIVFLKNIDNVAHQHVKKQIKETRMMMAGYLTSVQSRIFGFLAKLHDGSISGKTLGEMIQYTQTDLGLSFPEGFQKWPISEQIQQLIRTLNRPVRVCGMVRNQGEPGGGPFWVSDGNGTSSLQIVEKAQINTADPRQEKILGESTHFNPVDMVCGIKNFRGTTFDLTGYVDHDTYFISEKSIRGGKIKALELPGLWNGAMAHWITLMIEIPLETFNPVKTINDLLRTNHQPNVSTGK